MHPISIPLVNLVGKHASTNLIETKKNIQECTIKHVNNKMR